jgi:hypothetical protein
VHGSTIERCCAEESEIMRMVARREIVLLSRCGSEMCMMAPGRILYSTEDSEVICMLARRKGAVLRTGR